MQTISQAFENWENEIKPLVIAGTPHGEWDLPALAGTPHGEWDLPALAESWNDYTDALCKDGELTELQYNFCPTFDDSMPDEDGEIEFLLDAMGVTFRYEPIDARTDGLMGEWAAKSSHWSVTYERVGKAIKTQYSMGPAHDGREPDMTDVLENLLSDSDADGYATFEDWADDMGYDSDSRKAERIYNACLVIAGKVNEMFTASELSDLRDMYAER
mgnify:CR=1 FL=1